MGKETLCAELGSEYLKLACISKGGEVKYLTSLDIRPMMDEDISKFIGNYLKEKRIKTNEVISAIPARYTVTKNIELPSANPKEIKEIIKLQAGRYTPYSKEEIVIDYFPIGVYKGGYTKILLVIVNRDVIAKQVEILEGAQLRLKKVILVPETVGQWVMTNAPESKGPQGLFHFDYGTIDAMVITQGKPTFIRSLPIGAHQLINENDRYQEKFEEEVRKSLETYRTEQATNVGEILLTGSITKIPNLVEVIKKQTGCPVQVVPYVDDAWLSTEAKSQVGKDGTEVSFLSVISAGLYHRRAIIDFTPEEIRLRETMALKSREIIKLGTLVMFLLILFGAIFALKIYKKKNELNIWQKVYQTHHSEAEDLKEKKRKTALVANRLKERSKTLDAVTELYKQVVLRKPVWLSNIIYEAEKQMVVRGASYSGDDIFSLVDALEKTPYFKNVTNRYKTKRMIEGKEAFDFEIICPLE